MKINDIKAEVDACRSAEADIAKLRLQKSEIEARLSQGEASLNTTAGRGNALDKKIDELTSIRRDVAEIEYRIQLQERALSTRQALVRNYGISIFSEAKVIFDQCREDIMNELRRRVAPFVAPKSLRSVILEAQVLPLRQPSKLYHGIVGHLEQLKVEPVEACALILRRYERLVQECEAAKASIKG